MDTLRWDNFNEESTLKDSIGKLKEHFGMYPAEILAHTIYQSRENRAFCKFKGIRLRGKPLGCPKQENILQETEQEKLDAGRRNAVEVKLGESKTCYGLSRIMACLKETSETVIGVALLSMNCRKRLRSLLRQFFNRQCQSSFRVVEQCV